MRLTVEENILLQSFHSVTKADTVMQLEEASDQSDDILLRNALLLLAGRIRELCDNEYERLFLDDCEEENE